MTAYHGYVDHFFLNPFITEERIVKWRLKEYKNQYNKESALWKVKQGWQIPSLT